MSLKEKLSSRKFWFAVVGVVSGIGAIFYGETTEGTALIISAILGFMIAEGYIDAKSAEAIGKVAQIIKEESDKAGGTE